MKSLSFSLFLISSIVISCNKPADKTSLIKAQVVQTSDVNCHLPVLNFSEDSLQIRSLTGREDLVYVIKKLPADFNIQGKKLYVSVTTLNPEEDFACITFGPSNPHLKILDAKERQ